jgi:hypothetical protein
MVRGSIMSHDQEFTRDIEEIFSAVGPDVVTLMLESVGK